MNLTAKEFERILAQPGYSATGWNEERKEKPSVKIPQGRSKLEAKFEQLWGLIKGPMLQCNDETKFRFHPTRKWRFDFYHIETKVAIEIQGRGRHQSEQGYRNDREKINEAQRLGWTVFELTGDQIGWPELERIRDFIEERMGR